MQLWLPVYKSENLIFPFLSRILYKLYNKETLVALCKILHQLYICLIRLSLLKISRYIRFYRD